MRLLVKAKFDEAFSTKLLENTLRAAPASLRRNIRSLEFRVHPDNYLNYIGAIATRQGDMADRYLAGLVGDPTYGGVPVRAEPDVNIDCIELYHPDPVICVDVTATPQ